VHREVRHGAVRHDPGGLLGTVYDVAAWFELHCCGDCRDKDSTLAVSGFEKLGAYQFVR